MNKRVRNILIALDSFLAITAFIGGVDLLFGINSPPVDLLDGSLFPNYTMPGLALLIVVGGSALMASILLSLKHPQSLRYVFVSAFAIVGFETVEVIVIGSPVGVARNLQIFYFMLGIALALFAGALRKQKSSSP